MAKITLNTALASTGAFPFSQLNANFTKLQDAINNGVLWRYNPEDGQNSMTVDLNINGKNILNAYVDGAALVEVKRKAFATEEYTKKAKEWASVSEQYSEDAEGFASAANAEYNKALTQAILAGSRADAAAASALSVLNDSQMIGVNKAAIAALTSTVNSNKTATDASLSSLSSTVAANKTAADATASSLSALNTTVTNNKTSADATASSLSTLSTTVSGLNTTVSGQTTSISSVTTTANAALPKSGGTMTGAITMGSNAINFGSYSLVNSGTYIKANTGIWSTTGYRCQDGVNGTANSGNYFNFNWNSSAEAEVWIDTSRVGKITLAAVSDKQLKEDISYIEEDALSQVEQWKPAMFAYKARGILPKSALQMGFIANDLVAVSPECVTGKGLGEEWDENAPEGAYELVPVAIMAKMSRAIQQLSGRLKELEAK